MHMLIVMPAHASPTDLTVDFRVVNSFVITSVNKNQNMTRVKGSAELATLLDPPGYAIRANTHLMSNLVTYRFSKTSGTRSASHYVNGK